MNTNYVFVLDTNKQQLKPCPADRARHLLSKGNAAIFRRFPFTLILDKEVENPPTSYLELRIDPGAKFTGFALVDTNSNAVIRAMELEHRGSEISSDLQKRALRVRQSPTAGDPPTALDSPVLVGDAGRLMYAIGKLDLTATNLRDGYHLHSFIGLQPLRHG